MKVQNGTAIASSAVTISQQGDYMSNPSAMSHDSAESIKARLSLVRQACDMIEAEL